MASGWMDGWVYGWADGSMNEWIDNDTGMVIWMNTDGWMN